MRMNRGDGPWRGASKKVGLGRPSEDINREGEPPGEELSDHDRPRGQRSDRYPAQRRRGLDPLALTGGATDDHPLTAPAVSTGTPLRRARFRRSWAKRVEEPSCWPCRHGRPDDDPGPAGCPDLQAASTIASVATIRGPNTAVRLHRLLSMMTPLPPQSLEELAAPRHRPRRDIHR